MTRVVNIAQSGGNNVSFRNRIINGAMVISQRGTSATAGDGTYPSIDRYQTFTQAADGVFTVAQVSDAPAGFTYSAKITVTTADASITAGQRYLFLQTIEGFNVADLGFGASGSSSVAVSFWVKSSLTGLFGGCLCNVSFDRTFPFSYTINAANTWEQKTVTITGDTTGTWYKDNQVGMRLVLCIGTSSGNMGPANVWSSTTYWQPTGSTNLISTLNATLQVTGVQLEAGTTATPFEQRLYGTELALCQRYYVQLGPQFGTNSYRAIGFGSTYTTTAGSYVIQVPVPMRDLPSLSQTGTMYLQNLGATSVSSFAGPYSMGGTIIEGDFTMVGAIAANAVGILRWNNVAGTKSFAYSSEL